MAHYGAVSSGCARRKRNGGWCRHQPPLSQLHGPPAGAASRWAGGSRTGRKPARSPFRVGDGAEAPPVPFAVPARAEARDGAVSDRGAAEAASRSPPFLHAGRSRSASRPPSIRRPKPQFLPEPAGHQANLLPCRAVREKRLEAPLPLPLRRGKVRKASPASFSPSGTVGAAEASLQSRSAAHVPKPKPRFDCRPLHSVRGRFPFPPEAFGQFGRSGSAIPAPAGSAGCRARLQLSLPHARLPPCRPLPPRQPRLHPEG